MAEARAKACMIMRLLALAPAGVVRLAARVSAMAADSSDQGAAHGVLLGRFLAGRPLPVTRHGVAVPAAGVHGCSCCSPADARRRGTRAGARQFGQCRPPGISTPARRAGTRLPRPRRAARHRGPEAAGRCRGGGAMGRPRGNAHRAALHPSCKTPRDSKAFGFRIGLVAPLDARQRHLDCHRHRRQRRTDREQ